MGRKRSTQLSPAKQFGQFARVWHPGHKEWIHLGRWGSEEAEIRWRRLAAEYVKNPAAGLVSRDTITVGEVMTAYLEWLKAAGKSRNIIDQSGRSVVSVSVAYGDLPIGEFGPVQLKTWAASLADPEMAVAAGWQRPRLDSRNNPALGRRTIKAFCASVIRAIKWGIGQDLYRTSETRVDDLERAKPLDGLNAKPPKKRNPANSLSVDAALQELTPTLRTAVMILRMTGMRAGELLSMRPMDVRRGGVLQLVNGQRIRIEDETQAARDRGEIGAKESVWWYVPASHKTAHHGIDRVIPIMPAVQRLLESLPPRAADRPYISPKESMSQFRDRQRKSRKSKVQPSQVDRAKAKPKKSPTDRYQPTQFRQAILRACKRAGVEPFTSHQLRHSASTAAVDATGDIRAVQQLLGHDSPRTTEGYTATTMAGAVMAAAGLAKGQ
jgi:integrase